MWDMQKHLIEDYLLFCLAWLTGLAVEAAARAACTSLFLCVARPRGWAVPAWGAACTGLPWLFLAVCVEAVVMGGLAAGLTKWGYMTGAADCLATRCPAAAAPLAGPAVAAPLEGPARGAVAADVPGFVNVAAAAGCTEVITTWPFCCLVRIFCTACRLPYRFTVAWAPFPVW